MEMKECSLTTPAVLTSETLTQRHWWESSVFAGRGAFGDYKEPPRRPRMMLLTLPSTLK